MILITGGRGFIGTHTARALLDLGESCVVVQRRAAASPDERLVVERADLTDRAAFLDIGRRHRITGIVHLAGSMPWPPGAPDPVAAARDALGTLFTVVEAARSWPVRRLTVASTIGVYAGVTAPPPLAEDVPLPMTAGHVIPAFKKAGELLTGHLAGVTGTDIVNARIAAVWGPLGRPDSPFLPAARLVHAVAAGAGPDTSGLRAGDGHDQIYAADCGRAIALLQLAERLPERTYNVGGGRLTTNGEFVAALPGAPAAPAPGRDPAGPAADLWLDTTRLRRDTGYRPEYDTARGIADYLAWLRAGNPR